MRRAAPVRLADRSYDVLIGDDLLDDAGALIRPFAPRGRTALITDETVAALHGDRLVAAMDRAGVTASVIALPPGEQTKSFEGLASLCDRMLRLELDRGDVVTAFGGGVIGDLAGFAAAIYKRGIDFVQIPTTLLAQVDSSVGGKTAIDTPHGKNLIGAFHQPRLVLADLRVLATLPAREMRAGYAEVIKYGLLGDSEFFEWLEENGGRVVAGDLEALAFAVSRSVELKAEIVAEDEKEAGRRALLNLGHTFGHALEAETGYGGTLLHGEGVAIGCAQAFRFSASQGLVSNADAHRAEAAIALAGLPVRMGQIPGAPFSAEALVRHMSQDKKAEGGRLTFILAKGVGAAFTAKGVEAGAVRAFLQADGALP